jgi:hypothetical protein
MEMRKGAVIATAVAGMLLGAGCEDDDKDKDKSTGQAEGSLKCEGGNECAGHSECAAGGKNECQGMNECKGMGWVTVESEQECEKLGGTVAAEGK